MNKFKMIIAAAQAAALSACPNIAVAETTATCEPLGAPSSIAITPPSSVAQECGTFQAEGGGDGRFCQWQFPYRSDAAKQAFGASETALDGCFNKSMPDVAEVNHPDSYAQVFYETDDARISLSLKDKAQLNATFLFLRIETAP